MCGIAGWIDFKFDLRNQNTILENMSKTLSNRGPDASGTWASTHAALVHRRLIVVDPEGGSQPMIKDDGQKKYVITYNGELYNTLDLRKELESLGHVFTSNSDTEVLLVSYVEWGPQCIEHLNGIFAFGIWDNDNHRLFLGRDRFGVKPLFYTQRGSSLIFGSELKTLLAHPLVKPEIGTEGLAEIFALGPARTPGHGVFKGIHEVKPAHCILYDVNGVHHTKYWSLESKPHTDSFEDTVATVRDLVTDAIERQLVSDVPLSTFLSGGLDSSAITAIAANHFKKTGRSQLHTYSIDYVDNELFFKANAFQPNSDSPWVKFMSERFGTQHHEIRFDTPQLVDALNEAVEARDLPGMTDIDSSLWLFCRDIKKDFTVGLSGECADEIFGGYPWFHREDMLHASTFPWSRAMEERKRVLSGDVIQQINPDQYAARRYTETLEEVPRLPGESPLEARRREIFYLNIQWFMATLLDRKDRMSMANGLEVRVPFCDHRLVEYVWNVPWEMKAYQGREKGLLREALIGILPEEILTRKKSPYPKTHNPSYEKAVQQWLLEIIHEGNSPILPLIDVDTVRSIAEGKSDYGKPWFGQLMAKPQLFAYLIQLDLWMRKYHVQLV